jgi:hypothetical protein
MIEVNNTITETLRHANNENYYSNDEGTLESEIVSSDSTTAINNINLQKNFFSNDRNVFAKDHLLAGYRNDIGSNKLSEIVVSSQI